MSTTMSGRGISLAFVCLAVGCKNGAITPIITSIDPHVVVLAATQGRVDPANTCTPAAPPAPAMPNQWWDSLPPAQLPKVAGHGVVGTDRWRNTTDGCLEFRQDLYRTVFSYDLSASQPLKGLVTKAELSFSAAVVPAVRPNSPCQAMTGGAGALQLLRPGFTLPQTSFDYLGTHVPPQPFPASVSVFAMPAPWVPGPIAPGVTTTDGGGQRASFSVDVTDRLNGALNRGDGALGFLLSGSDEDLPTTSPPDRLDCRTVYRIGPLVITHL